MWLRDFESDGGTVDILVNNAGVICYSPLLEVNERDWASIMGTNVKATFFLSQMFAKHMKQNSGGVIINAHSFAVKIPSALTGLYAASKSALAMLTRTMAGEWAQYGIRVNAYSPGVVETDMTKPAIDRNRDSMLRDISLRHFGQALDVANAVLFLASTTSSYMTGVDLEVSGGKFLLQNCSAVGS